MSLLPEFAEEHAAAFLFVGVFCPSWLLAWATWGLLTGETWMVSRGPANEGVELIEASGKSARLVSLGLIGGAIALFGWKGACELPRLNRWYDWITGTGCVLVLIFVAWSYLLLLW